MSEIENIAKQIVAKGKGILAADESTGTMTKRLSSVNVESTLENRLKFRETLFSADSMKNYIGGVILYDETIKQKTSSGKTIPELIKSFGSIPGIKVDTGAKKLAGSPDEKVQSLAMSMQMLHEGLYFVEYTPRAEGTYIFHMVAFSQGTQSHGSAATLVLGQDLGGISKQIVILDEVLTTASDNLNVLQTDIHGFGDTLDDASTTLRESVTTIDTSVSSMSSAVENIEQASLQVNSLLFPIMGAIAVILALQISIIARRR